MAQNTLKQKARLFAQKHGLPYATALRAVDEPLHELRDLARSRDDLYKVLGFRLVSEESIYRSAYSDVPPSHPSEQTPAWGPFITEHGLSEYTDTAEMVRSIADRFDALRSVGAEDIWEYRELQRSGIHGAIPTLEPFFHHYGYFGEGLIYSEGADLGVFPVAIADFLEIDDDTELFPLTLKQFDELRSGTPVGNLRFPNALTYDWDRGNSDSHYAFVESLERSREEFAFHATSYRGYTRRGPKETRVFPKMQIFFRSHDRRAAEGYIRSLGLELSDFEISAAPRGPFEVQRQGALVIVSYDGSFEYSTYGGGTSQSTLIV